MNSATKSAALVVTTALITSGIQSTATAADAAPVAEKSAASNDNAAPIYDAAIAAVRAFSPAGSNADIPSYPPYGDEWTKMAVASFEKNEQALKLVHDARKFDHAKWNFTEEQRIKHLNAIRNLANIIGDAALLQHFRDEDRAAFETLRDVDHLVLMLRKDLPAGEHLLALVGIGLDAFTSYRTMTIAADLQLADGAKEVNRLTLADVDAHIKAMLAMPAAEPLADKLFVVGAGKIEGKATDGPSRARAIEQARRSDAERAMAAMSLACKVFQKQQGRWPANLDELSSKLPRLMIDPWGDGKQTLGYVLIKAGLPNGEDRPLVYSRCESKDGLAYRVDEPQYGFYPEDGTNRPRAQQKSTGQFRDVTLWKPKPLPAGAPHYLAAPVVQVFDGRLSCRESATLAGQFLASRRGFNMLPRVGLFQDIIQAVRDERYVIGLHANERLRERRIPGWQIISGLESGTLLIVRADAKPNPVVEVDQSLPDGTPVKTVWAWIAAERVPKLVTVHFFDL